MALPLQICFDGFEPSSAIEASVRQNMQKMERLSSDIERCRIRVVAGDQHQRIWSSFRLNVYLKVGRRTLVSSKQFAGDVCIPLGAAFTDLMRMIKHSACAHRPRKGQEQRRPLEIKLDLQHIPPPLLAWTQNSTGPTAGKDRAPRS